MLFKGYSYVLVKPAECLLAFCFAGDAEAAIRATEGDGSEPSSDEETSDFARIRRCQAKNGKGRKRQVIMDEDFSEDEEGMNSEVAINLASPEPFKKKTLVKTDAQNDSGVKIELPGPTEMEVEEESKIPSDLQSDLVVAVPEEVTKPVEASVGVKREAESGASAKPPSGPKRKKVLKTRINDRGKEGNEARYHVADNFVSHNCNIILWVLTFHTKLFRCCIVPILLICQCLLE